MTAPIFTRTSGLATALVALILTLAVPKLAQADAAIVFSSYHFPGRFISPESYQIKRLPKNGEFRVEVNYGTRDLTEGEENFLTGNYPGQSKRVEKAREKLKASLQADLDKTRDDFMIELAREVLVDPKQTYRFDFKETFPGGPEEYAERFEHAFQRAPADLPKNVTQNQNSNRISGWLFFWYGDQQYFYFENGKLLDGVGHGIEGSYHFQGKGFECEFFQNTDKAKFLVKRDGKVLIRSAQFGTAIELAQSGLCQPLERPVRSCEVFPKTDYDRDRGTFYSYRLEVNKVQVAEFGSRATMIDFIVENMPEYYRDNSCTFMHEENIMLRSNDLVEKIRTMHKESIQKSFEEKLAARLKKLRA